MNPIGENIPVICLHLEDTTNKNLLEALIVTGGSASCFSEQYRDLLLYLPQMLDEKNSNQQVHTAVQQYIQYKESCCIEVLFAKPGDTTSAVRQQGDEFHGATYGRRNRRRNVYAFFEVWMLWIGCLRTTTVVGTHGLDRFHGERYKMSSETRK